VYGYPLVSLKISINNKIITMFIKLRSYQTSSFNNNGYCMKIFSLKNVIAHKSYIYLGFYDRRGHNAESLSETGRKQR
jgi:hypothetical protein